MYNAVKDRIENVNGNKQMLQNFMLFRRKHKNCDNNNNRHDEITNLIKTKWNNKTTRERAGGGGNDDIDKFPISIRRYLCASRIVVRHEMHAELPQTYRYLHTCNECRRLKIEHFILFSWCRISRLMVHYRHHEFSVSILHPMGINFAFYQSHTFSSIFRSRSIRMLAFRVCVAKYINMLCHHYDEHLQFRSLSFSISHTLSPFSTLLQ